MTIGLTLILNGKWGQGKKIKMWKDSWSENIQLEVGFPRVFSNF